MLVKNRIAAVIIMCLGLVCCKENRTIISDSKASSATTKVSKKQTQAELSHKVGGVWTDNKYVGGDFTNVTKLIVPTEHTDHSEYIRYEGPGWESDKIGYRFYLDWRNAVDIFGKKTSEMVLQDVGLDGFSSYHEPQDWGMDILKVGKSLGIGSIAHWDGYQALRVEKTDGITCEILENGDDRSEIKTVYKGWDIAGSKTDLTSYISISSGSRLSHQVIELSADLENICTGIVNHENAELITRYPDAPDSWGYIATYGRQSLADDNLGMAILFKKENLVKITEDEHSQIVVLRPINKGVDYYFGAAWQQEEGGIKTKQQFVTYLENEIMALKS